MDEVQRPQVPFTASGDFKIRGDADFPQRRAAVAGDDEPSLADRPDRTAGLPGSSPAPQSSSTRLLHFGGFRSLILPPGARVGLWWPITVAPSATSARIFASTSAGI